MFNNLIESSSHAKEFKRRGSFLLFTSATYLALFVVTGVVSIYAYDAHLEEQNLEVVTLLPPQEIVPDTSEPERPTEEPPNNPNNQQSQVPERAIAMLGVDHPEVIPDKVSAERVTNLPLPPGNVDITGRDYNPPPVGGGGSSTEGGRQIVQPTRVVIPDDPPPAPEPTPVVPKLVKRSVINGDAISLPKPTYPPLAKQIKLQGTVNVQVLIDESGKVVSAKAVAGHPLFVNEAQRAAMQARFSPTTIGGQPVKISGVITYNFVIQQ